MNTTPRQPLPWAAATVLSLFFGLSTLFVSVVTLAQAWQEHSQSLWPLATARVEICELTRTSSGRRNSFYIRCRLSFAVDTEQVVAKIYSGTAPSRDVAQYPPNQIGPLETWVSEHPPGTLIPIHYDPSAHTRIVLVSNDMPPYTGAKTAKNLKLLAVAAAGFLSMFAVSRLLRPNSDARRHSSTHP